MKYLSLFHAEGQIMIGLEKKASDNLFHWVGDNRIVETSAPVWHGNNPSGDGPCVTMVPRALTIPTFLNDISCGSSFRYVCNVYGIY